MEAELRKACAEICEPARIAADIEMIWYSPPIVFDRDCVGAVKQAAATAGYENMEIVSGAGHDACYISRVAPTAMIFVPCRSEAPRVGKECCSTCSSRWSQSH